MGYKMITGTHGALSEMCRLSGKWGMHISHVTSAGIGPYELARAAPFLDGEEARNFWHREIAFILFDSEEELRERFGQVKGDDGPHSGNPYNGPANVHAITCGPDGSLMDENT